MTVPATRLLSTFRANERAALKRPVIGVIPAAGFEPAASCFGGKRSIHLSYAGRMRARKG
jgi:hypothetical protein